MDKTNLGVESSTAYFTALKDELERLTARIAELESVIKSHGIPVKSYCGGEGHYCMKESE